MIRNQIYRSYCGDCKQLVCWQEPTGRRVERIECPKCGKLLDAVVGSMFDLKGEVQAEARTYAPAKKNGR